jgi:hypothetical protein
MGGSRAAADISRSVGESAGGCRAPADGTFERGSVLGTDEPVDGLSVGVEDERRDATRAELLGEPLVGVDVDLRDDRVGLARQRLDGRLHHLTGPTPVGVAVDQHDVVVVDERL